MAATDRRSMLKLGAAGTAAVLGAPMLMTRTAQAQVAGPDMDLARINRFALGQFEVTAIDDGARAGDAPHKIFGIDQEESDVASLLEENFLPADRFVNSFTPTLVNTGSELILFDTGLGGGARGAGLGKLRSNLRASGYSPDDVTIVVITHFHGDHIGGIMENAAPAFPNARYVTGRAEYDFWTAKDRLAGPTENAARAVQSTIVPLAEKMTFLDDGGEVAPGVTAMLAVGHTPGHMVYHLESEGRRLLLTADTANHYLISLRRPDWHVSFDMDKDETAATRKRVFDMVAAERIPFIGYHMPFPAAGFVEKMDVGYRFVPVSYQMLL